MSIQFLGRVEFKTREEFDAYMDDLDKNPPVIPGWKPTGKTFHERFETKEQAAAFIEAIDKELCGRSDC